MSEQPGKTGAAEVRLTMRLILWAAMMILAVVSFAAIWYVGWPMLAIIIALLIWSGKRFDWD